MKRSIFNNKPKVQKSVVFIIFILTAMLYGCDTMNTKDNKIYEVNQDKNQSEIRNIDGQIAAKGINPFHTINFKSDIDRIAITESPDKKYVFYLSANRKKIDNDDYKSICGGTYGKFNLIKYDLKNNSSTVLKNDIPFISLVKWNSKGNIVAFCGEEKLFIYNLDKDSFVFDDEASRDYVSYFGWSPDGNRIYTENPDLVNNTIYYMDSNEKVQSYNSNETKYYKGKIDDEYYYVTINDITKPVMQNIYTLIVDSRGNKIKKLSSGKFRDCYKMSVMLLGGNGFGLYYIKNINNSQMPIQINTQYIYDAKFIKDGKIAYIVKNKDLRENNFLMIIADENGKEISNIQVSGSKFALYADGKKAEVSGKNRELIDFESNLLTSSVNNIDNIDKDRQEIFKTIRSAAQVVGRYVCTGKYSIEETAKYFINTSNPEQCALFDLESMYKERNEIITMISSDDFEIELYSSEYKLYMKNKNKNACVKVIGNIKNPEGSSSNIGLELELINKEDGKWYINGLSTFTCTKEYDGVRKLCEDSIVKAKQGKLFNGVLKGKDIRLGEIQFWQISEPSLVLNIDNANYCKVYLKVKDKGKENIYKMILHRDITNGWQVTDLKKERFSYLY